MRNFFTTSDIHNSSNSPAGDWPDKARFDDRMENQVYKYYFFTEWRLSTQSVLFKQKLEKMFVAMKDSDIAMKMLTLAHGIVELPSQAASLQTYPADRQKYLKNKDGTKRQYIDAYIHVKSQRRLCCNEKIHPPISKGAQQEMVLDKYTLQNMDDVQWK